MPEEHDEIFLKVKNGLETSIIRSIIFSLYDTKVKFELRHLSDLLYGYRSNFIKENNLENVRTFSILSFLSKNNIEKIIKAMKKYELLRSNRIQRKYYLMLTNKGKQYFKDPYLMLNLLGELDEEEYEVILNEIETKLYEKLSMYRYKVARTLGITLYMVCKNKVLEEISINKPRNMSELILINGVGERFIEKYGLEVQNILDDFYLENNI